MSFSTALEEKKGALIRGFCEANGKKARGVLIPYATEVAVIARMGTVPLAAKYMSEFLGRSISTRTVENLLWQIRNGKIGVSEDEILAAAQTHPIAKKYFKRKFPISGSRAVDGAPKKQPMEKSTEATRPIPPPSGKSMFPPEKMKEREAMMVALEKDIEEN